MVHSCSLYLRLTFPLFFCGLFFRVVGGGAVSFTASSQKPRLEFWVSPQMLLSELQWLVLLTEPHTEEVKAYMHACAHTDTHKFNMHKYITQMIWVPFAWFIKKVHFFFSFFKRPITIWKYWSKDKFLCFCYTQSIWEEKMKMTGQNFSLQHFIRYLHLDVLGF